MWRFLALILIGMAHHPKLHAQEIKTDYIEDRFFVLLSSQGVQAKLLLDSGGNTGIHPEFAWYWMTPGADVKDGKLKFGIESPFDSLPWDTLQKGYIRLLPPQDEETNLIRKLAQDGIIGHGWLGTGVWKFDYPKKTLTLLSGTEKSRSGIKVPLFFKGEGFYYPRFRIEVDGKPLDMLLDTGATSFFSPVAQKELGLTQAFSASSFIRESIFSEWQRQHPEWKVIPQGDRFGKNDLIRVPKLKIGDLEVGPVWFAKRPNKAYDEFMSKFMDCKCAGAVGGNVLRSFEIVVDYPNKTAFFNKTK